MRSISFFITIQQFIDGSKSVTRRLGWKFLPVGDYRNDIPLMVEDGQGKEARRLGWSFRPVGSYRHSIPLMAVEKAQGLKKGEKIKRLGVVEVVNVCRERLDDLWLERCYPFGGRSELAKEGFPNMTPMEFTDMFCKANKCKADVQVTRIEFRRVRPSQGGYIVCDPEIQHGRPTIRGTRILAENIFKQYAAEWDVQMISSWIEITDDQVRAAIDYWAREGVWE